MQHLLQQNIKFFVSYILLKKIFWTVSQQDLKSVQIVTVNVEYPRLHTDEDPSLFHNCTNYLNNNKLFKVDTAGRGKIS